MWDTAGEAKMKLQVTFSNRPFHMDEPVLADQQQHNYNRSVWTQDVV